MTNLGPLNQWWYNLCFSIAMTIHTSENLVQLLVLIGFTYPGNRIVYNEKHYVNFYDGVMHSDSPLLKYNTGERPATSYRFCQDLPILDAILFVLMNRLPPSQWWHVHSFSPAMRSHTGEILAQPSLDSPILETG